MFIRQFFNKKGRPSTCFWCFLCILACWESYMTPIWPIGVPQRGWGVLAGVLPASYWSPGSHIWLPAARPHTFLQPSRIGLKIWKKDKSIISWEWCQELRNWFCGRVSLFGQRQRSDPCHLTSMINLVSFLGKTTCCLSFSISLWALIITEMFL
jgi:hypothetical protein